MSLKPADFFLGIFDLLGILMPGALLFLWINPKIMTSEYVPISVLNQITSDPDKWIAFLFASYLLGHIISTCGGFLGVFASRKFDAIIDRHRQKGDTNAMRILRDRSEKILTLMNLKVEMCERKIISAYVQTKNSTAAAEIEKLRATARFFRSLTLVFAVISFPCFYNSTPVCIFLAFITAWLYFYTHWKQGETIYAYFIAQCMADGMLKSEDIQNL